MRLANKAGLITGAASGIGRAGAIRFAAEGAAVAVVDIDKARVEDVVGVIGKAGGKALALVGDLRDPSFSADIVAQTVKAFGKLDYAWSNAGHPGPSAIEGVDPALLDLTIDLNLRTMILTASAALPELRKTKGSFLVTSSTAGLKGTALSPVYSAVKFGAVGFTRALASRYAKEQIRVNAICPGGVDTPMQRVFVARPDDRSKDGIDREQLVSARSQQAPMGRIASPDEIANAALFLTSDEASYISGAILSVDGATVA
jgi:NAD(P)-dependent dehydrogenase (short-subunit alcohol dehydrogenase family)